MVNTASVSQAYPDIRHKLQKGDGVLAVTSSQIIEIAGNVFRNRDVEAEKGGREKNGRKITRQQIRGSREDPSLGLPPNLHPL